MKKLTLSLLKGLLVTLFFTGASIVLYTSGINTVCEVQANVDEAQVVDYLEECGYEVVACAPERNTISDWMALAIVDGQYSFIRIHVVGNNIVGHEVLPF